MKKVLFCVLIAVMALEACACAEGALSVVASNFPCYDFARQIVGDLGEVTLLLHPGVEAHSYEPSPADIIAIGGADLFVYIGGESEAWVDNILAGFDGGEGPASLRMMEAVKPLQEEGDGEHGHDAVEYDEHIWTSPKNAMAMVDALCGALCALDGEHAGAYRAAADAYIEQIAAIDADLADAVQNGARRELVFADRFPFLYLVREYGLDYVAAFPSCTADTEPTPQTILKLIQTVRQDGVPVIYTIEMSTQAVAKTVAEETGASISTLNSLQTVTQAQFDAQETYVSLMLQNAKAIREGLN